MSEDTDNLLRLGWREWIILPDICSEPIKAKIDTGARSSALHAESIEEFERDGERWVRFILLPRQRSDELREVAEVPVHDVRDIRSSSGEVQRRYVVRAPIQLGDEIWSVDLTLSAREQMGFRMLVGREAIRGRFVVDPGASFLWGRFKTPADEDEDERDDADETKPVD